MSNKKRALTFISTFSVLYAIIRLIPTFPMIGIATTFTASDILAPLYGIVFGPLIDSLSIIIGTYLSILLGRQLIFLGLDFLPGALNAITLGFLMIGKRIYVLSLFLIILIIYAIHPLSLVIVHLPFFNNIPMLYNWLHILSFIILISPFGKWSVLWVKSNSTIQLARGIFILSFIGTMIQHLTGSILFETVFGLILQVIKIEAWPKLWFSIFFIYPFERFLIILITTLIGTPLLKAIKSLKVYTDIPIE
ncbi:MAG: hypothetical protein QW372_05500 [Nitrososphaerales archaeon]